jgi:hypothetical protein
MTNRKEDTSNSGNDAKDICENMNNLFLGEIDVYMCKSNQ